MVSHTVSLSLSSYDIALIPCAQRNVHAVRASHIRNPVEMDGLIKRGLCGLCLATDILSQAQPQASAKTTAAALTSSDVPTQINKT